MKLLTKAQKEKLLANGKRQLIANEKDELIELKPVVKFFNPVGSATWIISESDPHDEDILFGLCDLGAGFTELGTVRLSELENLKLPYGMEIERDFSFTAKKTLSAYHDEALNFGSIQA